MMARMKISAFLLTDLSEGHVLGGSHVSTEPTGTLNVFFKPNIFKLARIWDKKPSTE